MRQEFEQNEPWQDNSYSTGSTNPPKDNSKLLMILLVAVILLGGIASVLGIMNVQLFRQVSQYEQESSRQPHFHPGERETTMPSIVQSDGEEEPALELEHTPVAPEHTAQSAADILQCHDQRRIEFQHPRRIKLQWGKENI